MWTKSFSKIYKNASKESVWKVLSDVNNWHLWDPDSEYCKLEGELKEGNFFRLKPKGAPEVKIHFIELIPNKKWVDCTNFPGAKMYDIYELEEVPEGLKLTATIKVTGFLKFIWVKLVAKNIFKVKPKQINNMINLAKKINV